MRTKLFKNIIAISVALIFAIGGTTVAFAADPETPVDEEVIEDTVYGSGGDSFTDQVVLSMYVGQNVSSGYIDVKVSGAPYTTYEVKLIGPGGNFNNPMYTRYIQGNNTYEHMNSVARYFSAGTYMAQITSYPEGSTTSVYGVIKCYN